MASRSRSRSPMNQLTKLLADVKFSSEASSSNMDSGGWKSWWATEWSSGGGWASGNWNDWSGGWKEKERWENHFDLWWTEKWGDWWTEGSGGVWIRYRKWKEAYDLLKKDRATQAESTSSAEPKPLDVTASESS